jgi:hypothetical protein
MRTCGVVLILGCIAAFAIADDKNAKPVTPEAAAKMVNEKCTVEMEVKSRGRAMVCSF